MVLLLMIKYIINKLIIWYPSLLTWTKPMHHFDEEQPHTQHGSKKELRERWVGTWLKLSGMGMVKHLSLSWDITHKYYIHIKFI